MKRTSTVQLEDRLEPPAKAVKLQPAGKLPNGHPTNHISGARSEDLRTIITSLPHLNLLYSSATTTKIWGVAQRHLNAAEPPLLYPEYTKPGSTDYVYRDLEFWTSGFFPGSLHLLQQRQKKYQHVLGHLTQNETGFIPHRSQLEYACTWWTENLHRNASLTGTHDLGFMICPWAKLQWELNHDSRAFETLMTAAEGLASRFDEKIGCIRSWDKCQTKSYSFLDPSTDFLVIIDNMMNLDLLFWAAANSSEPSRAETFYKIAVKHAQTTRKHHVRKDSSTAHVIVFDPASGSQKSALTNQGYSHTSCWSRGQAWAIAGFAESYKWSGEESFLQTSRDCADYFIRRLPESSVPPWDFDAPNSDAQPRDTSAALVAAYGMLLIHEALSTRNEQSHYLEQALRIVDAVCARHMNEKDIVTTKSQALETVENGNVPASAEDVQINVRNGDTIVNGATINNYEFAPRRWANHGLVYADYYFLLVGNKLLEMGIARLFF